MLIKEVKNKIIEELVPLYDEHEAKSIASMCMEEILQSSSLSITLHLADEFPSEKQELYEEIVKALKQGKPIQYIFKKAYFFEQEFYVNENVLIPRQETEELIQLILNATLDKDYNSLLDIGTGSGCIALSLKRFYDSLKVVDALDFSLEALAVAKRNSEIHNLDINFIYDDILNPQEKYGNYSIIVSNPPYVCEEEKKHMHINVLENEPASALYVPDDKPLLFYEAIVNFSKDHLINGGMLFFEINENFGLEVKHLLEKSGFREVFIEQDINNKDRIVWGIS